MNDSKNSTTEAYFIIPGKVQAKQRPKVYRNKYSGKIHGTTPAATRDYESRVKECYLAEYPPLMFSGAVEIVLNVYLQIPKSTPKKKRDQMLLGYIRPIARNGDVDNYLKSISDGLNGVAYFDDCQIVQAIVNKWYSEEPKAEVVIREVRK